MGKTLLLRGHPGIGKTTIIKQVVTELGGRAGGFYTEEISGPGGRKGFRLLTLEGQAVILAHKDLRGPKIPMVGRYGVDVPALDRVGVPAIQRAMQQEQIVIVDEIGRMELFSAAFRQAMMLALMGPRLVFGSIMHDPHPEADVFRSLAQVTVWEVEIRNRGELAAKALAWLTE